MSRIILGYNMIVLVLILDWNGYGEKFKFVVNVRTLIKVIVN